jgi:hypothetical protein
MTVEKPSIKIHTNHYTIITKLATTITNNLRTAIHELFTLRNKEHHTQIENNILQHSKHAHLITEKKITINNKKIFLN